MYERHDPAFPALHRVVRENLATFYAAIEQGWQSGLPAFVRAEFSRYLDCGVLERGFAHLACQDCGLPRLVAFTCAGRGFCPTCLGRRMNQTTLNLLAHVLPAQPLRQWVLTVPFPLRAPLAYEPGLMALVARVLEDSLLRWYRQRLAPEDPTAQGGLLTVIQRSSGDIRLNPHLHVVALDGVYLSGLDGLPVFRELARLKTAEVASAVPPPRQHQTRYAGVLSAAAHWRPLITPPVPADPSASEKATPHGHRADLRVALGEFLQLRIAPEDEAPGDSNLGHADIPAIQHDPRPDHPLDLLRRQRLKSHLQGSVMRAFLPASVLLLVAGGLACASRPFAYQKISTLRINQTTPDEAQQLLGPPVVKKTETGGELELRYRYTTKGTSSNVSNGKCSRLAVSRTLSLRFKGGRLRESNYVSNFASDATVFADDVPLTITPGQSTAAELLRKVGAPNGMGMCPSSDDDVGKVCQNAAWYWRWTHRLKFVTKVASWQLNTWGFQIELQVGFNEKGVVVSTDLPSWVFGGLAGKAWRDQQYDDDCPSPPDDRGHELLDQYEKRPPTRQGANKPDTEM